jgi:hypothetical protein
VPSPRVAKAAPKVGPGATASVPGFKPPYSDEVIRANTGRAWDEWFAVLDAWGAVERPHPEIARWVNQEHGVPGWWAQGVTVAYEQARGLRAPGQRRGGQFEVDASNRATWDDGSTRLVIAFTARGESKSQVALTHERVPDAGAADKLKAFWRERMAALKQVLEA